MDAFTTILTVTLALFITCSSSTKFDLPLQCTNGIMTTPTYNMTDAVFTVCANITIPSPALPIYNTLLDFSYYHLWNSFVYNVSLPPNVTTPQDVYVGLQMEFYTTGIEPGINTTSYETISWLEKQAKPVWMAWKCDPCEPGLSAEHVSLLHEVEGGTEYVSWETYYGATALLVEAVEGNLDTEYEVQGVDLRKRVMSFGY
jgi:hypothetical protein